MSGIPNASLDTRMTRLLGISHPVMNAGMGHVAVAELVAAVSEAGGLGLLATSPLSPEAVRREIDVIRNRTDAPFGANLTLGFDTARANAEVLIDEQVPVVNLSLGFAPDIVEAVHAYGGRVVSTVTTRRHARKAATSGVDAVIVTGHEAAGHGSGVSSLVLVPLIAREVNLPVIAAGGFADGAGLAAALMLGADGISMGTRFALSAESPVHERLIAQLLAASETDTMVTDRIDGLPSRLLASRRAAALASLTGPLRGLRRLPQVRRALDLSWAQAVAIALRAGRDLPHQVGSAGLAGDTFAAVREGDTDRGVVALGQVVGAIDEVLTCRELIEGMVADAEARLGDTPEPG
jgi:enoyl-[acyl-carrier protein] reductase II